MNQLQKSSIAARAVKEKELSGRFHVRTRFLDLGNLAHIAKLVTNDSSAANASGGRQGLHCFTLQVCSRYQKSYSKFLHSTYILHTVINTHAAAGHEEVALPTQKLSIRPPTSHLIHIALPIQ